MSYQNVLLIDDDEEDQEIFLAAAKDASNSVSVTGLINAWEALEKLKAKVIVPDLIFLDLNMPVMNGQQCLVEIKKNPAIKHIPIIIFSTSSNQATIQLMKELGSHDFITKPSSYDLLVKILREVLS